MNRSPSRCLWISSRSDTPAPPVCVCDESRAQPPCQCVSLPGTVSDTDQVDWDVTVTQSSTPMRSNKNAFVRRSHTRTHKTQQSHTHTHTHTHITQQSHTPKQTHNKRAVLFCFVCVQCDCCCQRRQTLYHSQSVSIPAKGGSPVRETAWVLLYCHRFVCAHRGCDPQAGDDQASPRWLAIFVALFAVCRCFLMPVSTTTPPWPPRPTPAITNRPATTAPIFWNLSSTPPTPQCDPTHC